MDVIRDIGNGGMVAKLGGVYAYENGVSRWRLRNGFWRYLMIAFGGFKLLGKWCLIDR